MGCCQSSQPSSPRLGSSAPRPAYSLHTDFEDSIAPEPLVATSTRSRRHPTRDHDPSQNVNKPLRIHKWTSAHPPSTFGPFARSSSSRQQRQPPQQERQPWTRAALEQHRRDFFDTRVTGHPEIWLTLRTVTETLQAACAAGGEPIARDHRSRRRMSQLGIPNQGAACIEDPARDNVDGLATAQSMLDAAGITLPSGDLVDGVYDETGEFYQLPAEVVADPPDLIENPTSVTSLSPSVPEGGTSSSNLIRPEAEPEPTARTSIDAASAARDNILPKPKSDPQVGPPTDDGMIIVKTRLSDRGGQDLVVSIKRSTRVRDYVHQIREQASVPAGSRIRLAYAGRILDERKTLIGQGWQESHVVNAMILPAD